jgi:hypothetical protein
MSDHADFRVELPPVPYPGLRPFNGNEWPIFFGRERMADEVVSRLVRDQFLVVHGDSGCGKSSLIRAGVLPRLEQENARGGLTWRTTLTQPRNAPLQLLAEALAALDGRGADEARVTEIRRILNFGADAPAALAHLLRRGPADHLCVLIDQFEELFAFARRSGGAEARLFVEILVALLDQPPQGLYAVVTMRSEFLGACAHYPGLAEAVNRAQYLLPRMGHADLMRAIVEPAALYGGGIAPELADRLITDSGGSQDQLPLIQHGLLQLWNRAAASRQGAAGGDTRSGDSGVSIELADYVRSHSLADSLSAHADEILASVEPPPHPVAEAVFRALTEINAEGQAIRRPQTVAQLAAVAGTDATTIIGIADGFRAEGVSLLTPFGAKPIDERTLIDISHEALIRCWYRIGAPTAWLAQEFQDGLMWRALLVQARDFNNDAEHLLTLATAEDHERWLQRRCAAWAERYGGGWKDVEYLVNTSISNGRHHLQLKAAAVRRRKQYTAAFVAFLGVVAVGLLWLNTRANTALARANSATATSLWNRLDFPNPDRLQDDELNALWEIGRADDAVKAAFFSELIDKDDRLARVSRRASPVLHALFPFAPPDPMMRLKDRVLREAGEIRGDAGALASLAPMLPVIATTLSAAEAQALLSQYEAGLGAASTGDSLAAVSAALAALGTRIDDGQADATIARVIAQMAAAPDAFYATAFTSLGASLAGRVTPERADALLGSAMAGIRSSTSANEIVNVTPLAQALAARVAPAQRPQRLMASVARVGQGPSAPEQAALTLLAGELTREPFDTTPALERAIAAGLPRRQERDVAELLSALLPNASPALVAKIGSMQVEALAASTKGDRVITPAAVLGHAFPRLEADERDRATAALLAALERVTNSDDAAALAGALAVALQTPGLQTGVQQRQAVAALIAAAHYADEGVADEFGALAATAAPVLTSAEARAHLRRVATDINATTSLGKTRALGALIAPLTIRLTQDDAAALLPEVWQWINATILADQLAALATLVPNLSARLDAANARRSLPACLRYLEGTRDPDQIGAYSTAALALANLLPADQRAESLLPVRARLVGDVGPDRLARFATLIPVMAGNVPPADADALLALLIDAIAGTTYERDTPVLSAAAVALIPRVSDARIPEFVAATARAYHGTLDEARLVALASVMEALAPRSGEAGGERLQTLVAWAPTPAHARVALTRMLADASSGVGPDRALVARLAETTSYPMVTGELQTFVTERIRAIDSTVLPPQSAAQAPPECPLPLIDSLSCPK